MCSGCLSRISRTDWDSRDTFDELGLLDGIQALRDLRQTIFRVDSELLERFDSQMKARRDRSKINCP